MENPVGNITKMKPKTLALVVVGGIGLGLIWRRVSGSKKAAAQSATGSATDLTGVDLSQLALAANSAGNLSGPLSDVQGSGLGGPNTGTTRDVGSINLPVTRWIITIGGIDYMIDDTGNITPINGPAPVVTGAGAGGVFGITNPTSATAYALPAYLTPGEFVRLDPSTPGMTARNQQGTPVSAVYQVTANGLRWVQNGEEWAKLLGRTPTESDVKNLPLAAIQNVPRIGPTPDRQYDVSLGLSQ